MPSIRLPLATSFLNRSSTIDKDSKIVNGYIEKYTEDHSAVVKRPGLSFYQAGAGCGQGMYQAGSTLYNASGDLINNTAFDATTIGKIWTQMTTDVFTTGIRTPNGIPRTTGGILYFENKFWYFGGARISDASVGDTGGSSQSTQEVYNSVDGVTWNIVSTVNCFPARDSFAYTIFNNKIFIIGGVQIINLVAHTYNDVWSSIDGITWAQEVAGDSLYFDGFIPSPPTTPDHCSLMGASACVLGNTLYVTGGQISIPNYPYTSNINSVWATTDGIIWTKIATAPWSARNKHETIVHNNKIYLMGGYEGATGNFKNDVWSSPDGITWTQLTASAAWQGRIGHSIYSVTNYLVLSGGMTIDSVDQQDVWISSDGITWTQNTITTPFEADNTFSGSVFAAGKLWKIAGGSYPGRDKKNVWATDVGLDTTLLGTSCIPVSFQKTGSSASTQYIMYKGTSGAFLTNIATNVTQAIVDSNYPVTTVPGIVFLDGYFFVMTPTGEIHNSALEDPTTWPSLDFITAEMEPDAGVAIAKHLNYLVAFGTWTTEFFYDAANALGSPLSRVDNAFMHYGCASGYSIVQMNNTLVWMSQTQQQGRQIAVMNGFAPQIISTPFVERVLAADDLATVYSFNTKVNGHDFYVLTLKTSNITLAYDFVTRQWFQWTSMRAQNAKTVISITLGTDGATATATVTAHGYADGDRITIAGANQSAYNGNFNITYVDANTFTYQVTGTPVSPATGTITSVGYTEGYFRGVSSLISNGINLVQDEVTGDLYKIDMTNYDDTTGYINFLVRTTNFDAGSMNTKYPARLEMIGDKEANSHLLVRYSNDDYVTYSKYRKLDLSKKRSRLNRLGSFKRRTFDLRHTDATPLRLEQVEMEIDKEGT